MGKRKSILLLCFFIGLISGCVSGQEKKTPVIQPVAESEKKAPEKKSEADALDFKRAVQIAVKNMMHSGVLDNPTGERYIVAISSIVDATKKGFKTAEIKQKLSADLAAGRKVRVVSVSSKTVSPHFIIAGRITQRVAHVRGGQKRQEYYLNLVLTEAKSGMKLWENTTPVVKKAVHK